jgi:hypothetical protein
MSEVLNETINAYIVVDDPDAYYVVSLLSKAKKPFPKDEQGLRLAELYATRLNAASQKYVEDRKLMVK